MSEFYYVTQEGYDRLVANINDLKHKKIEIAKTIQEARSDGNIAENTAYINAREEQALIEKDLATATEKSARAKVIDPKDVAQDDTVRFSLTVTLLDCDTEEELVYQIVGEDEGDIKNGKLSYKSPLASAILGKAVGDVVNFETQALDREIEVLKVEYK